MRAQKTIPAIIALTVIFFFTPLYVQAGEGLTIWPTEPGVSSGFKAKATFAMYEIQSSDTTCSILKTVYFILRVRTGNSLSYSLFEKNAGQFCDPLGSDGPKQQAIILFLNDPDVGLIEAICPDCPSPSYVHLKRVFDDTFNRGDANGPIVSIADFELVVNQDPPSGWWEE